MSLLRRGISQSFLRTRAIQPQYLTPTGRRYASTSNPTSNPWRTGAYAGLFVVSAGVFAVYYFDARSAMHRYILTPVLRNMFDPETGHKVAVKVLRTGLGPKDPVLDDARLKFEVCVALCWEGSISKTHLRCGEKTCPIQLVLPLVSTKTERRSTVGP